jgi:hypothetical protein
VSPFGSLDAPIDLASTPCSRCGKAGVIIVALGPQAGPGAVNDNGTIEMAWCGHEHATLDGWPFIRSELDAPVDSDQSELFFPIEVRFGEDA